MQGLECRCLSCPLVVLLCPAGWLRRPVRALEGWDGTKTVHGGGAWARSKMLEGVPKCSKVFESVVAVVVVVVL